MKIRTFRAKIEIEHPYAVAIMAGDVPVIIRTYKNLEELKRGYNNFYDTVLQLGLRTIPVEILNKNWNSKCRILSDLIKD